MLQLASLGQNLKNWNNSKDLSHLYWQRNKMHQITSDLPQCNGTCYGNRIKVTWQEAFIVRSDKR